MVSIEKTFSASEGDVVEWCRQSGDSNQIHLSEEYAEDSLFGERVVPGVMALGWVSGCIAQLGDVLGGDVILKSIGVEFVSPISLDEEVTVSVQVAEQMVERGADAYVRGLLSDSSVAFEGTVTIVVD